MKHFRSSVPREKKSKKKNFCSFNNSYIIFNVWNSIKLLSYYITSPSRYFHNVATQFFRSINKLRNQRR
uniref:Uncharacterized protein n=1 Tax=Rhizophora mucronata TaxID=61149 RepID=A0A2P2PNX6_RHIMU